MQARRREASGPPSPPPSPSARASTACLSSSRVHPSIAQSIAPHASQRSAGPRPPAAPAAPPPPRPQRASVGERPCQHQQSPPCRWGKARRVRAALASVAMGRAGRGAPATTSGPAWAATTAGRLTVVGAAFTSPPRAPTAKQGPMTPADPVFPGYYEAPAAPAPPHSDNDTLHAPMQQNSSGGSVPRPSAGSTRRPASYTLAVQRPMGTAPPAPARQRGPHHATHRRSRHLPHKLTGIDGAWYGIAASDKRVFPPRPHHRRQMRSPDGPSPTIGALAVFRLVFVIPPSSVAAATP